MTTAKTGLIAKSKSHAFGKDVFLLGLDNDGIKYWLEAPKWDCGWYWGFGYVETYRRNVKPSKAKDIDSHSHVSGLLGKQETYNFDKRCFVLGEHIHNLIDNKMWLSTTFTEKESWELSELFNQFYFLKTAAENFGRGKCHTADTTIESWENKDLVENINTVLIPRVTARIIEILTPAN